MYTETWVDFFFWGGGGSQHVNTLHSDTNAYSEETHPAPPGNTQLQCIKQLFHLQNGLIFFFKFENKPVI